MVVGLSTILPGEISRPSNSAGRTLSALTSTTRPAISSVYAATILTQPPASLDQAGSLRASADAWAKPLSAGSLFNDASASILA